MYRVGGRSRAFDVLLVDVRVEGGDLQSCGPRLYLQRFSLVLVEVEQKRTAIAMAGEAPGFFWVG